MIAAGMSAVLPPSGMRRRQAEAPGGARWMPRIVAALAALLLVAGASAQVEVAL